MARIRRAVGLDDHVPEAVAYVASVVGRELPQPVPDPRTLGRDDEDEGDEDEEGDSEVSREPRMRGRAPIFELGQREIGSLLDEIDREIVALPDLQRPFVWEDTKVRELLDSLFLGFPVGTVVLWHTATEKEARGIGADRAGLKATTLVIDGQQRLTSLYAVMRGAEVYSKDGEKRRITIAFRPRDGRFEVADAAIRRDPEFLADVSELWRGPRTKMQVRKELLAALRLKGRTIDETYEQAVESNLERAQAIRDYRFPTVEIRKTTSSLDGKEIEEDVADIFVRINNQGTKLGQADFVLTLLSVFHGQLRDQIEDRARRMSDGAVVAVDTQQLLRVTCAVAFGRARMSAVYRFLRGLDPVTGDADLAGRKARLDQLDAAAGECMEPLPWQDFLLRVRHAGFVHPGLVASKNAVVNAYALYVRGRKAGVDRGRLDELIARWLFATLLTARYSGSSETIFEQDLGRLGRLTAFDGEGFARTLDELLGEDLTGDFWTHTLVGHLETQRGRAPSALAFRAAQVVLGARALFSDNLLQNLFAPSPASGRAASELHHLFPKAWLEAKGVRDRRDMNQVANMADVGWYDNTVIGSQAPAGYVTRLRQKLGITDDRWSRACAEHALPVGWESLEYGAFLVERRRRMADVIRAAYRKLGGEAEESPVAPPWFLPGADAVWQRIGKTELALRDLVREVYTARFGDGAARAVEEAVGANPVARDSLLRALRSRPAGADPLSVVDYLFLGQLVPLLAQPLAWEEAQRRLDGGPEAKRRLQMAVEQIAPVRNEIAHVREVAQDRLLRATVACNEVLELLKRS